VAFLSINNENLHFEGLSAQLSIVVQARWYLVSIRIAIVPGLYK